MYVWRVLFAYFKPCGLNITCYNRNYQKYYDMDPFL